MNKLKRLKEAIGVLALSPAQQMEFLFKIGHFEDHPLENVDPRWNIDELALQFEDCAIFLPGLIERREIGQEQARSVVRLDQLLVSYSGEEFADFWTVGALNADPRWTEIRKRAQESLALLG
jgi:hypothetical protein